MNTNTYTEEPDRVRRHTPAEILEKIEAQTEQNIRFYATQPEDVLNARIEELEREWDIERVLETNASALALSGAVLAVTVDRKGLLLTCGVLGFLLQHATTGWCPPLSALRRMGVRTRREIDAELFALKALRGDFKNIPAERPSAESVPAREILESVIP
jgi:hypothetical protein